VLADALPVAPVLWPVGELDGRLQLAELPPDLFQAFYFEAVVIDTDISLHLRHGAVNLQAIEIEITIADVKGMGSVLLVVPYLFHAEDQSLEPREPTIVMG